MSLNYEINHLKFTGLWSTAAGTAIAPSTSAPPRKAVIMMTGMSRVNRLCFDFERAIACSPFAAGIARAIKIRSGQIKRASPQLQALLSLQDYRS